MARVKITLTKSPIERIPAQHKIVAALRLGKLSSSVTRGDVPAIRRMVTAVSHSITVEDVK